MVKMKESQIKLQTQSKYSHLTDKLKIQEKQRYYIDYITHYSKEQELYLANN